MSPQIPPPFYVPDDEGDPPRDPDSPPEPDEPDEDGEGYKMPPSVPPAEIREPRTPGA